MRLVLRAMEWAERAHRGQVRKYTGEPYIVHPLEVAQTLQGVGFGEQVIAAALLHDVVEDTPVTLDQIEKAFGHVIAAWVSEVTDVSRPQDGNRATRKAIDRAHLARASYFGKSIKLADMISNTRSITQHDPDFAVVYMAEKAELLPLLSGGSEPLYHRAKSLVDEYRIVTKEKA